MPAFYRYYFEPHNPPCFLNDPAMVNDTRRIQSIERAFQPLLKHMADISKATSYLAVQCGTREYLCIDAIQGSRSLPLRNERGQRESLVTSAIGKIFLSFDDDLRRSLRLAQKVTPALEVELDTISDRGYALDLEEAKPGLHCVAFPLYHNGVLVAAMAGPIDVAIKKARTAALFQTNSIDLGAVSQPGGVIYSLEFTNGGLISFGGGVVIRNEEGAVVGAVGVAGATVEVDEEIAQAAAKA